MQRLHDGTLLFSPSDLISFLQGDYAAWHDRLWVERPAGNGPPDGRSPNPEDPEKKLAADRGTKHEEAHLAALKGRYDGLIEIARGDDSHAATHLAMMNGAPVIYQGELQTTGWRGFADFLHKRDGESLLGSHYYEPWDTKLARHLKPYFLLQLSSYAELLEDMQGRRPPQIGFVLGDGSEALFSTEDCWHYFRRMKRRFEAFHAHWSPDAPPDPAQEREFGRWSELAERQLRERDDVTLVAGITRSQCVRLRNAGIHTVAQLTSTTNAVPRIASATLARLRDQATMQMKTRANDGVIAFNPHPVDPDRPRRGFALLPVASPNDIFFDIEGFPYHGDNGLEYLLGVVTVETGVPIFKDWWSHNENEERAAFVDFIDWVYERWTRDQTLHVYHYAAYEKSAIWRLVDKYDVCRDKVTELLEHEVLVDLYTITRQAMVIGTESYSLKDVEHLYMPPRDGSVTSAGSSVVEYQRWLDSDEPATPEHSPILRAIRDYNAVDCQSTAALRDWLLVQQGISGITWIQQPVEPEDNSPRARDARELAAALQQNAETLRSRAAEMPDGEDKRVAALVAELIEFHRRCDRPAWGSYFRRMLASDETLFEDRECLAGLVRTATPPRQVKRSTVHEYAFDPAQECKISVDADSKNWIGSGTAGPKFAVESLDAERGSIALKIGPNQVAPERVSLVPIPVAISEPMKKAMRRFAERWSTTGKTSRAVEDLLYRRPPALQDRKVFAWSDTGDATSQSTGAIRALDHSTICIQGPPGTGKTTIAAHIIATLVLDGKRVGVVANSHEVINNLIVRVAGHSSDIRVVKAGGDAVNNDHELFETGRIECVESKVAADIAAERPLVIGGTVWLFSQERLEGALDYLFVEEAGQFALANAIVAGQAARNIVLIGDQMQLAQPTQGAHDGESGDSVLEYALAGYATVPPHLGVFLGVSYRMQPEICRLISTAYYDSRLGNHPSTNNNTIAGGRETIAGVEQGVRFLAVSHDGNTHDSDEECEQIERLYNELLACKVRVKDQPERPIVSRDILVVAPFNMQVRALKRCLPDARIGTVDKFQGQEAPVVIVSMCSSTLDDAPRGASFLMEKNRLNVAISRAQALAVVVASPALGDVRVRSVRELELVNGWCRIEAYSSVLV